MSSNHIRPSWDNYGLALAKAASSRADCTRRQVGAVLMADDNSIVATGYNGGPSKGLSCLAGECPRGRLSHKELPADSPYDTGGGTCIALHAEWNVMLRASWEQMIGATLYVTEEPCHICKSLIAGTRISEVVWPTGCWVPNLESIEREFERRFEEERQRARPHPENIMSSIPNNTDTASFVAEIKQRASNFAEEYLRERKKSMAVHPAGKNNYEVPPHADVIHIHNYTKED